MRSHRPRPLARRPRPLARRPRPVARRPRPVARRPRPVARRAALTCSLTAALLSAAALAASPARAGELDLAIGADAGASSWDEGAVGHGTFKLGYRFLRPWFQLTYLGKIGYASIDERVLSYFAVGAEVRPSLAGGRVRPYLRASLVHQHEEPLVAIEHQPFQSLIGVGDGIRHRGGGALALGVELPLRPHERGRWYASIDLTSTYFPDDRGPEHYVTLGAGLGVTWDLAARPAAAAAANRPAGAGAGAEVADAR